MVNPEHKVINYSDVVYSFFSDKDAVCHDKAEFHFIMYVISGRVIVTENGREHTVNKGQCVFIRKDHRVMFSKSLCDDKPYKSVTMRFNRNYLRKFYQNLSIDNKLKNVQPLQSSVRILEKSPYLDSLFLSIVPFFESGTEPRQEFITQKMEEGIWALLNLDKGFYPALFDFADPWKIDILDFLNMNYMYDLSMEEIASYTGRSLATFKRDFAKISDTTPQKWLIRKRLEKAYDMIVEEGRKVGDVCYDVGFKNRSHFTVAFKKQYGFSPAGNPVSA